MPELVYPPKNQTWPPVGAIAPGVTKHIVGHRPPRPDKNEQQGPVESFGDICDKYDGLTFETLMEFNFELVKGEPHYFEKINWFLKHKLNCKKTTAQGNFMFIGGETIYIPAATVSFHEAAPIIVVRRTAGAIRWVQFTWTSADVNKTSYMIPGVDRESSPIDSKLPGTTGIRANKIQGKAAVVEFLATTSSSRLANYSVETHLKRLEPPFLLGGEGIGDVLQPRGPHEGVVVMVRRTKNRTKPWFPQLPFGKPIIFGFGNAREAGDIIERRQLRGGLFADPGKNQVVVYEYYWGTRL